MSQIENIAQAGRAMGQAAAAGAETNRLNDGFDARDGLRGEGRRAIHRDCANRHLLDHIGTLRTLLSAIPGQPVERARVELAELHATLDVLFGNPHDDQEEEIVVRCVQRLVHSIHGVL